VIVTAAAAGHPQGGWSGAEAPGVVACCLASAV